jgi:hypothetical protein
VESIAIANGPAVTHVEGSLTSNGQRLFDVPATESVVPSIHATTPTPLPAFSQKEAAGELTTIDVVSRWVHGYVLRARTHGYRAAYGSRHRPPSTTVCAGASAAASNGDEDKQGHH